MSSKFILCRLTTKSIHPQNESQLSQKWYILSHKVLQEIMPLPLSFELSSLGMVSNWDEILGKISIANITLKHARLESNTRVHHM